MRKPLSTLLRNRAVPLIVATALLMENIDGTVLSTSLPQIARDLGADPIHLKLALTSYLLALAIFIPASGWAADRFGARQLSSATSFSAVLQQLSGSIGITVAALGLEAMQKVYGGSALALTHFPAVYALIAGLSLLSVTAFGRLSKDAGASLLTKDKVLSQSQGQA